MKINKLVLENFSSYENRYEIDFSTEDRKPIVLIGGQNGAGKTSIFTAIKLALYGAMSFGYTGENAFYYKKIKSYINLKSLQQEDFKSGVSIEIEITSERDINIYSISRYWEFVDNKLVENYTVKKNGSIIDDSEYSSFENYLYNIIPPELFDLFLFDGEEIGNIFSNKNYNKYVKKAVMTMCGLDSYSMIQNFCKNYTSKCSNEDEKVLTDKFETLLKSIGELENNLSVCNQTINNISENIETITSRIEEKSAELLKLGGYTPEKLEKIENKILKYEKKRTKISHSVKSFVENDMPFYLLKDFSKEISEQMDYEEKIEIYDYVRFHITQTFLKSLIGDNIKNSEETSKIVCDGILCKIEPPNVENKKFIFELSRDEISSIENLLMDIEIVNTEELINDILRKISVTKQINNLNKKIRSFLSIEDSKKYQNEIDNLNVELVLLKENERKTLDNIEMLNNQLAEAIVEKEEIYKKIMDVTQNKFAYDMSNNIEKIMNRFLDEKTESIRERLSRSTINNLSSIFRKNNLVSEIYIKDDFKFELFQEQSVTTDELYTLINNLGVTNFLNIISENSKQYLFRKFNVQNAKDIKYIVKKNKNAVEKIELSKKIELSMLSKGERQIFVLALYWAIIQVSNKKIPFIIDTPYARIDARHRKQISKKVFPNISNQVVILSTDEEVTKEYYNILRSFISKEYLLTNNKNENKTTIKEGYFFKGD